MLARKEASVTKIEDFKGKRFNIGNPARGTRATMDELMAALAHEDVRLLRWPPSSRPTSTARAVRQQDRRLAYGVGNPSANIQDPTTTCGGWSIERPVRRSTAGQKNPYYAGVTIPAEWYATTGPDKTYGVVAAFVTSSKVSNDDGEGGLRQSSTTSAAASGLRQPRDMIKERSVRPLHDGAVKFKEKGWM